MTGVLNMDSIAGIGADFSFIRGGRENFRIYQKSTAKNMEY